MNDMKKIFFFLALTLVMSACTGNASDEDEPDLISHEYLAVTPTSLQLSAEGQTAEITIKANRSWSIVSYASWLTISPNEGSGNATVRISADKNTTGELRSTWLSLDGGGPRRDIDIEQPAAATDGEDETNVLTATPTQLTFDWSGETKAITITSNVAWAISQPSRGTLSALSGIGNAEVTLTLPANDLYETRTGSITISGEGVSSVAVYYTQRALPSGTPREPGEDDNQPPS